MSRWGQVRQGARFATNLYVERARDEWAAHVVGDPFARLRMGPGRKDPYPIYDRIRAAGGVVGTRAGNWALVDHAACRDVLRSRRYGVRPEHAPETDDVVDLSFLERNPPAHTRLRRLAAPAFGPRQIATLQGTVERTVDGLLDDLLGHRAAAGDGFDLVDRLAAPLPIQVISDLLGVPDADNAQFTRYGMVIGSALGGIQGVRHAQALLRANVDLERMFVRIFDERRRDPRDDVISHLVTAEAEERMTPREMVPMCTLLLIAGFETTVNLVGNGVDALLDHPGQWAALVDDPSLAHAAAVETLRYDAPVQRTVRISFDDTEVLGRPVRAGQFVHVLIGGANRDPAVFENPDVFDLARADAGEHLAFSAGLHHCLGRPLAELEATVLLRALAERMPGLRRAGAIRRRNATLIRGPVRLPVAA